MKITLENIGQIKNAEIDLSKDLIVLCGGNNTGKTYAAYTVYGLFEFTDKLLEKMNLESISSKFKNWTGGIDLDLMDIFLSEKENIANIVKNEYLEYLPTVFASSKYFFKNPKISLDISDKEVIKELLAFKMNDTTELSSGLVVVIKKEVDTSLISISLVIKNESNSLIRKINWTISRFIGNLILQAIFKNSHIEPAERPSTIIFSQELLAGRFKIIDDVLAFDKDTSISDYIGKNAVKYSLPINDSLVFAGNLKTVKNQTSEYAYLADKIEKNILKGKMKISEYGGVMFNPEKSKLNLDIKLTASSVKSLASIIFYLRHLAKVGDFYIIDEPELNLHPDNQRKIARIIAQMVNAGIKVMISTHSDYIIRELNNLIMLNASDKGNEKDVTKLLKKYGYQKEETLDYNKIGAYLFTSEASNVAVTNLEITSTGFEIDTIDKETEELNESSSDIFFTLHNA